MATTKQVDTSRVSGEHEYDDWDLIVSGVKVSVQAYSFLVDGESLVLDDPWDFSIVDRPYKAHVVAYLVKEASSGNIEVLVDEVLSDGSDTPYTFKDGVYAKLATLWFVTIPPNTTSLDGLEIHVFRTVES